MPKQEPHFDAAAVLEAVAAQDLGLIVSTNNPKQWRQIMYAAMRAGAPRAFIYAMARSERLFMLLRQRPDGATGEQQDEADNADNSEEGADDAASAE